MTYRISYDVEGTSSDHRTRIRLIFKRFGWQAVGGSSLRYPPVGQDERPDDLFGQVIPALWCFRSFVAAKGINVKAFSFSADAEADYREDLDLGHPIVPAAALQLVHSGESESMEKRLSIPVLKRALTEMEEAFS